MDLQEVIWQKHTKTYICLHSEYRPTVYHFVSVLILTIFYKISIVNI